MYMPFKGALFLTAKIGQNSRPWTIYFWMAVCISQGSYGSIVGVLSPPPNASAAVGLATSQGEGLGALKL